MQNLQNVQFFGRRLMMKKLLVLLMVIGMASVTNASLVLNPPTVTPPATVDLTAPVTDVQQSVFIAVTGDPLLNAGTMVYTGSLSAITPIDDPDLKAAAEAVLGKGAVTKLDFIELFDGTITPPAVSGTLVTYSVTSGTAGWVCMLNGDLTEVVSCTEVVPEPITIALLGLGGLMLRRRN
jgi:hypothetical protein